MRSLYVRYADFLRPPGTLRFMAFGFLARLPIGTLGIATLLHVRELSGSIAFAGSVVGAQLVAAAAMGPVLGRMIDTRGLRPVLRLTAFVPSVSILLILFAAPLGLSRYTVVAAAIATGAFLPPITPVIRTIWRQRYNDEQTRRTAYTLDVVTIELSFTLGPALIAALIATASPQAALGLAWLFTAAAVPLLIASGGLGWWKQAEAAERHLLGPLREPRMLVIYATCFALTATFGALEVGYPGFAVAQATTAWGPALIAINSVGSALGGILYGGLRLSMPVERQLPWLLGLLALPIALHLAVDDPWAMAPLAFVAGILIAPSIAAVTLLVSRHAPAHYATEAFTWSGTAILTGVGTGIAVGGALTERFGPPGAFLLAVACALAASLLALLLRRP